MPHVSTPGATASSAELVAALAASLPPPAAAAAGPGCGCCSPPSMLLASTFKTSAPPSVHHPSDDAVARGAPSRLLPPLPPPPPLPPSQPRPSAAHTAARPPAPLLLLLQPPPPPPLKLTPGATLDAGLLVTVPGFPSCCNAWLRRRGRGRRWGLKTSPQAHPQLAVMSGRALTMPVKRNACGPAPSRARARHSPMAAPGPHPLSACAGPVSAATRVACRVRRREAARHAPRGARPRTQAGRLLLLLLWAAVAGRALRRERLRLGRGGGRRSGRGCAPAAGAAWARRLLGGPGELQSRRREARAPLRGRSAEGRAAPTQCHSHGARGLQWRRTAWCRTARARGHARSRQPRVSRPPGEAGRCFSTPGVVIEPVGEGRPPASSRRGVAGWPAPQRRVVDASAARIWTSEVGCVFSSGN
jgi:hypothetical protein